MSQLKLLSQLRKCFKDDSISLYYHGDFTDSITDKIITLMSYEGKKKIRSNLAFTIAESFQNIVRHKNSFLGDGNENVFGIRGRKEFIHVFSSNLVLDKVKDLLLERINWINGMEKTELKEAYMKILDQGELNEKGGAGMGLIEMSRRSGNPLQYELNEVEPDVYAFNLQVDFTRKKGDHPTSENLVIEENSIVNDLMIDNDILFIYKGSFKEEIMASLLPIVESCAKHGHSLPQRVYKAVIGLVQNIQQYGDSDHEGKKRGLFALTKIENGYYVCSGNYSSENPEKLREIVNDLNMADEERLNEIYDKFHDEREDSERIGLVDIRRSCAEHIELKFTEDARGTYTMLGAIIAE